jgi:hypothetical protein
MYPLNMTNPAIGGYAVANCEDDHVTLTGLGYGPAYVALVVPDPVSGLRADLLNEASAAGIKVDGRWSDKRLQAEIDRAALVSER